MFAYCENNPVGNSDSEGEFPIQVVAAAVSGVVNLATSWASAKATGQTFTFLDGAVAFVAGAVGVFGSAGRFASAAISGFWTAYSVSKNGGTTVGAISCGALSAGFSWLAFSNLAKFSSKRVDHILYKAATDASLGWGSNLIIAGATTAATAPRAPQKSKHKKNNVKQILQETSFRGGTCYCYDKDGNYMSYYVPYHEVTDEDIVNATNHIIDYLYSEKVESMQFQVDTDEGKVDFFSEQAIVHMADVKVLFIGGIKLCYICIVIFVLCLVYLILTRKHSFNILLNVYLRTLIVFGVATILIGLFAMIDFDTAFEVFHKIIFPDSSKVKLALSFSYTDTLTNVLTAEFFMHIGFAIGAIFIILIDLSIFLDLFLKKRLIKNT